MRKPLAIAVMLLLLAALGLFAYRLASIPRVVPEPVVTEDLDEPVRTPSEFGARTDLETGRTYQYPDGLALTLVEAEDSRCPRDVQCVWAGELKVRLRAEGGAYDGTVDVSLGTMQVDEHEDDSYRYRLMHTDHPEIAVIVEKI